jgi:hypothetical protein
LFLETLKRFNHLNNEEDKFNYLVEIYNGYLCDEAPLQLNVQKNNILVIEEIIKNQREIPHDVFGEILREVKELLKDTFSRFKESKEFEEFMYNRTNK